eukprot:CAMPEP_0116546772 /NCGR_PEP_ID=MMETSP0397-20121206/3406_1 /TAXON_ID=216820 /ORGANISM="Cyclophora tenuis, Strain ECT3854" /LENGTH=83 /DNA_ID=CAMNT_0004071227 /DNA_START=268 /DNA_END=515 /DNA_ORIENTATION=+
MITLDFDPTIALLKELLKRYEPNTERSDLLWGFETLVISAPDEDASQFSQATTCDMTMESSLGTSPIPPGFEPWNVLKGLNGT